MAEEGYSWVLAIVSKLANPVETSFDTLIDLFCTVRSLWMLRAFEWVWARQVIEVRDCLLIFQFGRGKQRKHSFDRILQVCSMKMQ
jgi:hypothetical protein